jgi:hypothetical protein
VTRQLVGKWECGAGVESGSSGLQAADGKLGTLWIDKIRSAHDFVMEPISPTAEVKPVGTLLYSYCGSPQELRGTKVCLAQVVGRPKESYVVLRKISGEAVFAQTDYSVIKTNPPSDLYTGMGVEIGDEPPRYAVEKFYELEIRSGRDEFISGYEDSHCRARCNREHQHCVADCRHHHGHHHEVCVQGCQKELRHCMHRCH